MTYTITQFANKTNPTGPQLDNNFNAMALQAVTPCTVTGTDALTLTQKTNTFTITGYAQSMQISGVAAASSTAAMTARLGALAFLKVYRDSPTGPTQAGANDVITGNAFTLLYDAALDTGNGGWHLFTTTAGNGAYLPLTGGTVTGPTYFGSLASITQLMVGASAATVTRILTAQATLTYTVTPANTTQDQNIAVPGAQIGDVVSIGAPSVLTPGVGYTGYIPAAGTVAVRLMNATAASIATIVKVFRTRVEGYS